ncbi:hypothetical protein N431DRAFT_458772 [Stipitochalara longipes BDJ]|nr:hypothetical protein N431DRAFT_458772 [Stipitochalara longipes BDJ]
MQAPKTFENASKSPQNAPENSTRRQPPKDHVKKALEKAGKPQPSAANAGEGPSGTPRSQKIKELYTTFQKRRKEPEDGKKTEKEGMAPKVDGNYVDQLRDLHPKYAHRESAHKVWAFDRLCNIMDFRIDNATGKVVSKQSSPYRVDKLLNGGENEVLCEEHTDSVRWIHLPANNMTWLETLMKRYYEGREGLDAGKTSDATIMQEQILYRGWWDKKQRSNRRGVEHARFMEPLCKKIVIDPDTCENEVLTQGDNMVLFELFDPKAPRDKLASGTCLTPKEIEELPCTTDEKLIRLFLLQNSPLHVRRTLDQSLYYTLADTSRRDGDQVVYRYMKEHMPDAFPAVLMVGQCWLWILNGNTVITCFPQRWNTQLNPITTTPDIPFALHEKPYDMTNDKTDVLQNIVYLLSGVQGQKARTAWGLAEFIVHYCARSVFDSENMPDEEHQFLEFFSHSISNVMDKQVEQFDGFIEASKRIKALNDEEQQLQEENQKRGLPMPRAMKKKFQVLQGKELDALFDITQEGELLKEIKDIMDELQMIIHVNESQEEVISKFREILLQKNIASELEKGKGAVGVLVEGHEAAAKILPEDLSAAQELAGHPGQATQLKDSKNNMVDEGKLAAKEEQGEGISEAESTGLNITEDQIVEQQNQGVKPKVDKGKSVVRDNRQGRQFKAELADLTAAEEMLIQSKNRKEIVNGLYKKADRAYVAIRDLLELKQKQANISEARSARQSAEEAALQAEETTKQGYSIMLFTIVTILFLPLSSLASIFALDAQGLSTGSFKLGIVFAILFPISIVVVSVSFVLAFHEGSRRLVLILLRICYNHFPSLKILASEWLDDFEIKHLKHPSSSSGSNNDKLKDKKPTNEGAEARSNQSGSSSSTSDQDTKNPAKKVAQKLTNLLSSKKDASPTNRSHASSNSSNLSYQGTSNPIKKAAQKLRNLFHSTAQESTAGISSSGIEEVDEEEDEVGQEQKPPRKVIPVPLPAVTSGNEKSVGTNDGGSPVNEGDTSESSGVIWKLKEAFNKLIGRGHEDNPEDPV